MEINSRGQEKAEKSDQAFENTPQSLKKWYIDPR